MDCSLSLVSTPAVPVISVFPQNSTVIQPETANFSCKASGFPLPSLQWFKQDGMSLSLLSNSTKYDVSYMIAGNLTQSYLTVSQTNPFDTSLYICEASNDAGNDSQSSSLQVKGEMMSLVIIVIMKCTSCFPTFHFFWRLCY